MYVKNTDTCNSYIIRGYKIDRVLSLISDYKVSGSEALSQVYPYHSSK